MKEMDNQKFDFLIKRMSAHIVDSYFIKLHTLPEFKDGVDTSPLINLTLSAFLSALEDALNRIKDNTVGEQRLFDNVELTKTALRDAIANLPHVSKVEYF